MSKRYRTKCLNVVGRIGETRRESVKSLATFGMMALLAWQVGSSDAFGESLVSHYTMNEGGGDVVGDSVGGVNGARNGDTSWSGPHIGPHLWFINNNSWVDMGAAAHAFERTDAFSFSFWFFKNSAQTEQGSIISKMKNSAPFRGYEVSVNNKKLGILIVNTYSTGNRISLTGTADIATTGWKHIVVTYDGSSTAAGVKAYVDGVEDTLTVNTDALSGSIKDASAPFKLAARDSSWLLKAALDDVQVYDSAISQTDANWLLNHPGKNLPKKGTIFRFK